MSDTSLPPPSSSPSSSSASLAETADAAFAAAFAAAAFAAAALPPADPRLPPFAAFGLLLGCAAILPPHLPWHMVSSKAVCMHREDLRSQ